MKVRPVTLQPWRLAAVLAAAAIALSASVASADKRLPIFDTHVHYSEDAWQLFDPGSVVAALNAANVPRALVSSTPDDGTLKLYGEDADRFVPILRPYRSRADMGDWFRNPDVPGYIAERLRRGIYRGIGEFHLFDQRVAATPEVKRVAAMAVERDIVLHVHSGADPVRALFAAEPNVKILWAHAGMSTPPEEIGKMLDRYPRLWAELAFRAGDIAPGGRLDSAWRDLMLRHVDRFMIGTDTYVAFRWYDYGALIGEHRQWLAQLPRPAAEAIAYCNAARRFGAGKRQALQCR